MRGVEAPHRARPAHEHSRASRSPFCTTGERSQNLRSAGEVDLDGFHVRVRRCALTSLMGYEQPIDSRCEDRDLSSRQPETNLRIDLSHIYSHTK